MNKLATFQIIWPPVPSLIFAWSMNWVASFNSPMVTVAAFTAFTYVLFLPALIAVLWPKKRGAA